MSGWNEKVFAGIDPGATGAMALIAPDGTFVSVQDYPGDECLLADMVRSVRLEYRIVGAVIEIQQAMPKQGVSSTFALGVNYGSWLMALAAFDIPFAALRPNEWKRHLGYPAGDYARSKEHSLLLARRRWPEAADYLKRKKDNGRAEALLLAQHAMLIFGARKGA